MIVRLVSALPAAGHAALRRAGSSPLARRTAGNLAFRVAGTGLSFLSAVILARLLGQAAYGAYVHWMALAGLAGAAASLGVPQLVMREIAAARGRAQAGAIRGVATAGLAVTLATALLMVVGGAALALGTPHQGLAGLLLSPPLLASLTLALGLVTGLVTAVQLGFEHVLRGQLGIAILQPGLLVVLGATCWLLRPGAMGVSGALLLQLATALAVLLASLALLLATLLPAERRALLSGPAAYRPRVWAPAGFFLMANQLLVNAQTQLDVLLLGWLAGPDEVAIYHAASRGAYVLTFLFGALVAAVAPTVARLHAAGRHGELQATLTRSSVSTLALTLPVGLALALAGTWYLGLFGHGFAAGYPAFLVLIAGWTACIACGPGQTVLLMCGRARLAATVYGLGMALNLLLDLVLIPPMGATGAALASAVTVSLVAVAWSVLCLRRLGCRVDALAGLRPAWRRMGVDLAWGRLS